MVGPGTAVCVCVRNSGAGPFLCAPTLGLSLAHYVFVAWGMPHRESWTRANILLMLMEDVMNNPDANTLYVLISSLLGAVISLSFVWYSAAAYAPGLVA